MKRYLLTILLLFTAYATYPQARFDVHIEPMTIAGLGGLQSYAFGQHNGKWLIVGGRLDGLHQRQPWASFDDAGHNRQLFVIDPVAGQTWTAPLTTLPTGLQEQLSSTNMEFLQEGDYLYIVGGYGYSATAGDHVTFPNLAAIKVPATIDAIVNGTAFAGNFRQLTDQQFAVAGGRLNKVYDTFYLTGGHRFDGRYNPMGHPTHTQTYTNAVRKFRLTDDGQQLNIHFLAPYTDPVNLHRRDFNVSPQIMPNGDEGLTAFSGVFQTVADIPFLNAVDIDSSGYTVNNTFSQYYNHYHCAHVPIYGATDNEMHTLFFGGIAQYYDSSGTLVQDNDVPFVRTIARVTRSGSGAMGEYKLPVEMPGYMGAGAEFIPVEGLPTYPNGVLKLDDLPSDTTLIGYVYGGISSSAKNIFWINDGTQSTASNTVLKVYLIPGQQTSLHDLNVHSNGDLRMQLYPNPTEGDFNIDFHITYQSDVTLKIFDEGQQLVHRKTYKARNVKAGKNTIAVRMNKFRVQSIYFIMLETEKDRVVQNLIIND